MRKIILLSLILLNVLAGWAQESSRKWMVITPDTANELDTRPIPTIYDVVAETDNYILGRNNKKVIRIDDKNVLIFHENFFKDYEEFLCKTYKLHTINSKKHTTGQLDFYPTRDEIFMRLIWDNATDQHEIYRIDIERYGIILGSVFHGTLERACTTQPKRWKKVTTQQDMYSIRGDFTGFYNGNALFVEDTTVTKKDIFAFRQSLEPKKSLLDSLFAESNNQKKNHTNKNRHPDASEKHPSFPGGEKACMQWLAQHIKYPSICVKQGIQGRVFAQFVVEKDGTITRIKVLRSPDPNLSDETIRVLANMPKWKPGIQQGKPVRVKFSLPVMFRLGK